MPELEGKEGKVILMGEDNFSCLGDFFISAYSPVHFSALK